MAGTRTVHRGSRGRFAGAGSGKAEQVRVGRGYKRGTAANARPQKVSLVSKVVGKPGTVRRRQAVGVALTGVGASLAVGAVATRTPSLSRVAVAAVGAEVAVTGVRATAGRGTRSMRPKNPAGSKVHR